MTCGFEIWATESGFDSRLVCDDPDDVPAVSREVLAKLRALLTGTLFDRRLPPKDLDELACVLWVPVREQDVLGYASQDDIPGRSLRALAEAAIAELDRT